MKLQSFCVIHKGNNGGRKWAYIVTDILRMQDPVFVGMFISP